MQYKLNKQKIDNETIQLKSLYKIICLLCVLIHFILFALFILADVTPLIVLNGISIIIYSAGFILSNNNYFKLVTFIAFFEVSINVLLSCIFVGWDYGFYFYSIALISMAFYCNFKYLKTKFILSGASCGVFFISYFISNNFSPLYITDKKFEGIIYIINSVICFCIIIVLSHLYSKSSNKTNSNLNEKNQNLQVLANTDPLTGLYNRRNMIKRLSEERDKLASKDSNFALVMIDIDNFKMVNDKYGHICGDYILKKISLIIRNTLRKDDVICRWGGEEILILLPDTCFEAGKYVAEKLRANVDNNIFIFENNSIHLTITAGVCTSNEENSVGSLVQLVDKRLYIGKANGKNCVVAET